MADSSEPISRLDRLKLRVAPIIHNECSPSGNRLLRFLRKSYHRFSGVLEYIGYPSPRRHKEYYLQQLKETVQATKEPKAEKDQETKILMLGAMSPSSIADMIEIVSAAGINNPSLTVIDICRTPLSAGQDRLRKIAEERNVKLNLIQSNAKELPFADESFSAVFADQVYNFLEPNQWNQITQDIMNLIEPNGRFINVIATYKKALPFFGKKAKKYIDSLIEQFPEAKRKILSVFQLSYMGITGIINNQTGLSIPKESLTSRSQLKAAAAS